MNWTGGFKGEIVKVGLYRVGKDASVVAVDSSLYNGDNNFTFPMQLQTKVKPGEYQLRIDNTNNLKPAIPSGAFKVKRKIPLVAKIAAGVAVGTAIYYYGPDLNLSYQTFHCLLAYLLKSSEFPLSRRAWDRLFWLTPPG